MYTESVPRRLIRILGLVGTMFAIEHPRTRVSHARQSLCLGGWVDAASVDPRDLLETHQWINNNGYVQAQTHKISSTATGSRCLESSVVSFGCEPQMPVGIFALECLAMCLIA